MSGTEYSVYIVRCADNTYYTGIAIDVERRIVEHECSPRGAKYLKGRGPISIVFRQPIGDRAEASRAEYRVKKLQRSEKEALIDGRLSLLEILADD